MRVLTVRLRGVVGKFMRDAFIKGKNTSKGWIVASKLMDDMRQVGDEMIFKINFKKAYDFVN